MAVDINKNLLFQFYGLNETIDKARFLSSSKGVENFENVTDTECLSTENLLSSEETGKNQNTEDESEKAFDDDNERNLSKSPHILEIDDLLQKENEITLENESEIDIIDDLKEEKNIPTRNFTRLEDTFTKAIAKVSDQNDESLTGSNSNLSTKPVVKAKRLWRQKTMLSKENLLSSSNLFSKFDGTYLDLNNGGMCAFPIEILQQVSSLKYLYLDSNNLAEIPEEFFTTLKSLKWLDVRNNNLTTVPSSIKGHACLETLLLQGNSIEKLPLEIGLIPNLKNLQLAHNPLTFPPKEILDLDCSRLINFLREEWNKENPNEKIELRKITDNKIEKKPSTIICYDTTTKNSRNRYRQLQSTPKSSVRSRAWNYKPSSRCQNSGDITLCQKAMWIKTAKQLLQEQTAKLQKSIDKNVLNKWRYDYKRSKSSCSNVPKRSLRSPFALHEENADANATQGIRRTKSAFDHLNSRNFNEKLDDFVKELKELDNVKISGSVTPHSEQRKLQNEIGKIIELQRKLENLKFYNDSIIAPYKGSENTPKKYIPPPSIII